MADATDREACVARHRDYEYDVGRRLNPLQRDRITAMVAPIRAGESVLDVGCNSGYIVEFLPLACAPVTEGIDAAPALVALARTRLRAAHVAAAESLPYPDGAFDAVILGEILEHVHDPIEVLREARRVARRLIVGSTPHESGTWGPNGSRAPAGHRFHVRCFTAAELRSTLAAAGLRDLRLSTSHDHSLARVPQIRVFAGAV